MKIAIDARIINSTTGRYVERLLHHLEMIDHENTYLILVREKDRDYYTPTNPNFSIRTADFKDYSFGEQLGFARLLYGLDVDFVHFCMPQQPLLYIKPSMTTVHDLSLLKITKNDDMSPLELKIKQGIFRVLLFVVAHKNKHLVAPSNYTIEGLVKFARIKRSKVTLTYEGSDIVKATNDESVKELSGKPFIMYVGRAEPYKNNRQLIKAHQKLLKIHPDLKLVIVGSIDILRRSDIDWVKQFDFKQIIFFGYASNEQLAWLYTHTLAYVFPSSMEGFGLPGLEAMSYGAPVVSSDKTCLPEIYGDAPVYFNPDQLPTLVNAIDKVIQDKHLRDDMKQRGLKQASLYSWKRMAEQTLEVYKSIT